MARTADADRELTDHRTAREVAQIAQFLHEKHQVEYHQKIMKELQPSVLEFMESLDDSDDKGTKEYELPEPIEGFVRVKLIKARKTQRADDETIYRILREKGLIDTCTRTVTVVDDDAIAQAALAGKLSDEEMEEMFPVKVENRLMTPKR